MDVGSVFTRLGYRVDEAPAHRYKREVKEMRSEARRDIVTDARVDVDRHGFDEYGRRTKEIDRHHRDVVQSSGRVRTAFGSVWARGGAAFAALGGAYALTKGVQAVVGAYGESQTVATQTNTVLKSTGGIANVTAKHVGDLATSLSRKTGADDEAIASAENLLLTFTNVRNETGRGNKIFDRATTTALDLSRALGMDLHGASIMVGKALNDPVKGMMALGRAGVQFTQKQKDQIKALEESGHHLQAQKIVLKELETQVGGSARAYGKTLPGALDRAKTEIGNVAETLGKKLAPWLTTAATKTARFLQHIGQNKQARAFIGTIGDVVRAIGRFIGRIGDAAGGGGRLGRIFDNVKTAVADTAHAFAPLVSWLARAVTSLVRFASKFAGSKAGLVALHGAIGALVGRLTFLAAAWAVGKISAFVSVIGRVISAVRTARTATVSLSTAMKATPWGIVFTIIGTVAGALGLFSDGNREAKATTRDLTDALDAMTDAMRGVRDLDIDAAAAKANYEAANVGVQEAERRLNRLRRNGKGNTLEAKAAEADLAQAKVNQKRASRDLGDVESNASKKRRDAINVTKDAISTGNRRIHTLQEEIGRMKAHASLFPLTGKEAKALKDKQAELNRTMANMPGLRNKLKQLEAGAQNSRGPVRNLRGDVGGLISSLSRLARQKVRISIALEGVEVVAAQIARLGRQAHIRVKGHRAGGKAGPGEGGPIIIYGEGEKAEWWISQEGDKRQNVAWGVEALETLTGRQVVLARGGHRRGKKKRAPHFPSAGHVAGTRPGRADDAIRNIERDIARSERRYGQLERDFGLSQEEFVVEKPDGTATLDQKAIDHRAGEIDTLIKYKKEKIHDRIIAYRKALKKAIKVYHQALKRLAGALRRARRRKAGASVLDSYRSKMADYRARIAELGDAGRDLDLDLEDVNIDIRELRGEKADVLGTTAPTAAPDTPTGDSGPTGPGDPADPTAAPPSPSDIAAAAFAELQTYRQAQADSFAAFGSNFARSGANPFAQQDAGLRYFGAGGGGTGLFGAAAQAGAGVTVNIEQNFNGGPPPHLWTDETVNRLSGALRAKV